jgi:hypothetical protein
VNCEALLSVKVLIELRLCTLPWVRSYVSVITVQEAIVALLQLLFLALIVKLTTARLLARAITVEGAYVKSWQNGDKKVW